MENKLSKLISNSYSPLSKFRVACIVTTKDKKEFYGVNVENSSYKDGLCAEQVAISNAITNGYKEHDFENIYIYTDSKGFVTPCFLCRQLLSELFEPSKEVICINKNKDRKTYLISELCVHPFEKEIK